MHMPQGGILQRLGASEDEKSHMKLRRSLPSHLAALVGCEVNMTEWCAECCNALPCLVVEYARNE